MPADYRIDIPNNLVFSFGTGLLTIDDLIGHQRRLRSDPAFKPTLNQLTDFCSVSELNVTADGIRQMSEASFFAPTSRRAIVVDRDVLYGLARMYEILRDRGPEQISVFRSYPEALAWLGLPPDYPRMCEPVG